MLDTPKPDTSAVAEPLLKPLPHTPAISIPEPTPTVVPASKAVPPNEPQTSVPVGSSPLDKLLAEHRQFKATNPEESPPSKPHQVKTVDLPGDSHPATINKAPHGTPPSSRKPLVILVIILALVLIGSLSVFAYQFLNPPVSPEPQGPTSPVTELSPIPTGPDQLTPPADTVIDASSSSVISPTPGKSGAKATPTPSKPAAKTTPTPSPAQSTGSNAACVPAGCSGQLCVPASKAGDTVTTCEMKPEYACYDSAKCEKQVDGSCGWTVTPELTNCLKNPPPQE